MQNNIHFYKMESLGNDFVIIDANQKNNIFKKANNFFLLEENFIKKISHRNIGVGCDQIAIFNLVMYKSLLNDQSNLDQNNLLINTSIDSVNIKKNQENTAKNKQNNNLNSEKAKLYLSIYNQDGSDVSMCVNIVRCIASLVFHLYKIKQLDIFIFDKLVTTIIEKDNLATINIGKANVINSINETELKSIIQKSGIEIDYFKCINVGNNHLILIVNEAINENLLDKFNFNIEQFGKYLSNNDIFKELAGVNVNFVKILNRNKIALLVYELGVGLTFACGSGAAASFYAVSQFNFTEREITAQFKYGNLNLSLNNNQEIIIKGDCNLVFNGTYFF